MQIVASASVGTGRDLSAQCAAYPQNTAIAAECQKVSEASRQLPRRIRNRLADFDYSADSIYFITSCIHNKMCYFGVIENGEMKLNRYGQIALQQWQWLQSQYPYIISHAFTVMPNHIHAVLQINHQIANNKTPPYTDSSRAVPTPPVPMQTTVKIKSVSELIGAYKTTVSKQIHILGFTGFQWQRSFFDHIIRNEKSYIRIIDYIQTNPQRWNDDTFFNKPATI